MKRRDQHLREREEEFTQPGETTTIMYPSSRKTATESQIISAEIVSGLLLTVLYRIISKNIFPQGVYGGFRLDGEPLELTCSLVCVWFASNVKFLLLKSNKAVSLTKHSTSRLMASLGLLVGTCWTHGTSGVSTKHIPVLDLVVFFSFVLSSFTLMVLDHQQQTGPVDKRRIFTPKELDHQRQTGPVDKRGIFTLKVLDHQRQTGPEGMPGRFSDAQRFFLHMDFFATFIFGLLWLVIPDWLLSNQFLSGGEDDLPLHLTRAFGAMMAGDSLASLAFPRRHTSDDTAARFSSRAVGALVLLMFLLHSHSSTVSWPSGHLWMGLLGSGLWAGNSVLGYLTHTLPHTPHLRKACSPPDALTHCLRTVH